MSIYIAQKLIEKRKAMNITQEQVASVLGITPQSISKWERGEGYPDITMLPAIADFFRTTVDDMLGIDTIHKEAELEEYRKQFSQLIFNPQKRLELTEAYHRKYPSNTDITSQLIYMLIENELYKSPEEKKRIENLCNDILSASNDTRAKEEALITLCSVMDETTSEKYFPLCPSSYALQVDEMREKRNLKNKNDSGYLMLHEENILRLIVYLFTKELSEDPMQGYREYSWQRSFISFLGIPDAWLGFYALLTLKSAARLFASDQYEHGKQLFEESISMYKKWFSIKDGTPLKVGNEFFLSDIATNKNDYLCYHISSPEAEFSVYSDIFLGNERGLYWILTCPSGWEMLNSFREDSCYKQTIEWLKSIIEN